MVANMGLGEVKKCAHCDGNGVCKAGFRRYALLQAAGEGGPRPERDGRDYLLHVRGQRLVWVGPEVVQIVGQGDVRPGKSFG